MRLFFDRTQKKRYHAFTMERFNSFTRNGSVFPLFARIAIVGLVFFCSIFSQNVALAAARKGYEAKAVSVPVSTITLAPGETKLIPVTFKNIGKAVWNRSGKTFVSMYTAEASYRDSVFVSDNWFDATHASLLKNITVNSGGVGRFNLVLHAPDKTGTYKESFGLVAENVAWIPGGLLKLNIIVRKPGKELSAPKPIASAVSSMTADSSSNTTSVPTVSVIPSDVNSLAGILLLRSEKIVTAEAGQQIAYKVGIKNTGSASWSKREIRAADQTGIVAASVNNVMQAQVAVNTDGVVSPGTLDFLSFAFTAPSKKGNYVMKYQFAANGVVVPDLTIDIPVNVTQDAGDLLNSPLSVDQSQINEMNTITEPIVRIGVLIVDQETANQVVVSCNTSWKLFDGNGALLSVEDANAAVTAYYKTGHYNFDRGRGLEVTSFYLRFVPDSTDGVCKIENFDKRITRHAANAENTFRNILELRYNSSHDRTWMINELPMELYLHGLGETSELSNYEFKKTLITIARTFALYQWERATKHADEFFHMMSTGDDQVYRGYEYEMNNPSIGKAAEETRGITVNYDGKTAITPYFSRSDGRTRDWHEVWGGTVAWAKSVPCPCDAAKGSTLWGHGVGLSASEALCMANNGKTWKEILTYFYQGIDLKKRWN